jgi:gamma-glutamyltranspeptidase
MSRVSDAVDRAGPRAVAGHGSMVATDHPIATDAAIECLREGGSATDAAVCAALAGPSGGGVAAIVWDRARGIAGWKSASAGECRPLVEAFGRAGLASGAGLAEAAEWVGVVEALYRGHSIFALAPGGLVVLEALALLDDWPVVELPAGEREHLAIETIKLAYADHMDPRDGPRLSSEAHLERRRDEVGRRARADAAPAPASESAALHVSVVDADGQCCALVMGPASPLTPACVFRAGLPWIVVAASGTHEAVADMLLRSIDLRASPEEAVRAPRRRWLGGARVCFEHGFDPEIIAALADRGHVPVQQATDFGVAQLVAIDRDMHSLIGASDPRRGGKIGVA